MLGQPATVLSVGLAAAFGAAARLRRGRPLHPDGLVLNAALSLHGAPQHRGVAFLDEPAELRGVARLSRSIGLPAPLPDVLGLALRWQQPVAGATGPASDLLLATTGHTMAGRRLLRPATRWAPGTYGSLFTYATGSGRVLLGAVARRSWSSPADFDALAHAIEQRPLLFDLVVASPAGPWERFGVLELDGPALQDVTEPMRFNPIRHPIPGLNPAAWHRQLREPAYVAAQRTPHRTGVELPTRAGRRETTSGR
ncbi:hypothetical protein [Nonomuraea dietziae]|uniref:hypothetical protein n=1 Tax=Nonomuraea dietziae TaxID=65515 RepID=UPI0033F3356F